VAATILVVEDEHAVARGLQYALQQEGYEVSLARSGEEGFEAATREAPDLILLDVRLPGMDGFEVLRRLRAAGMKSPVLMLTARDEEVDKVIGLELGADDYLTKPFDKRELVARVQAIVRRSKGHAESLIRTGRLIVNLDARTVEVDGQPLHLTGKEYGILELLSLRKGTTLTKEMFLNHLYGGMDEPELKIIDVFVCKLRKKLAQATEGDNYIETVWGRGYVLRDPMEDRDQQAAS
jgi:two-component system cell cycle response regulator CtrA